MLIDTHCHLSFKAFNDSWPEVVKRAREKDVQMIAVGAAKATSEKSIAIAEKSDGVFAAIGLHPTHVEDEPFDYEWFTKAADNPKVVAIGETGIDYYHLPSSVIPTELHVASTPPPFAKGGAKGGGRGPLYVDQPVGQTSISGSSPRPSRRAGSGSEQQEVSTRGDNEHRAVILQKQEDLLRQHLVLAKEKNLSVILHCRDSKTESVKTSADTNPILRTPSPSPFAKASGDRRLWSVGDQGFGGPSALPLPSPRRSRAAGSGQALAKEGITAYDHLYRVITDFGYTRCVLHCFGGDWEIAKKFLDLGCLISFTGIVTYKNAGSKPSPHPLAFRERGLLEEVVRNVPLDRFMIETDSPYLAPEPYRGQQNEPALVEYIARAIAEIRGGAYEAIAKATSENARRFFGIG